MPELVVNETNAAILTNAAAALGYLTASNARVRLMVKDASGVGVLSVLLKLAQAETPVSRPELLVQAEFALSAVLGRLK